MSTMISLRLDDELLAALDKEAKRARMTRSDFVRAAVRMRVGAKVLPAEDNQRAQAKELLRSIR